MRGIVACAETPAAPLHVLRDRLAERLGPGIGIACMGVDGNLQALYPEELAAIWHAVPRRQREFAAGREAARQAMAQIGWPPMAIPSAPDRSPVWPEGLAGSISHTGRACVAVVCPLRQARAIGIDIEDHRPIEATLWPMICTPQEMALLSSQTEWLRGLEVAHLFSVKEAVYKWQYPLTKRMLDFQDVQIALDPQTQTFAAQIAITDPSTGSALGAKGHILTHRDHIVSWVLSQQGT